MAVTAADGASTRDEKNEGTSHGFSLDVSWDTMVAVQKAVHVLVLHVSEENIHFDPDRSRWKGDEPTPLIPSSVENDVLRCQARRYPKKKSGSFFL